MSLFKNAICSTLLAAGTSIIFDLPTPLAALSVLAAGTTVLALPKVIDGLRNCMSSCKKKSGEFKDYSIDAAKHTYTRASSLTRDAAWACSPTNPDQNVLLGTSIGYVTGTIAEELFPLVTDMPPPNKALLISASTFIGAVAGQVLSQERINRWTSPANTDLQRRKSLPSLPGEGADANSSSDDEKDKKEKKKSRHKK